ncbi:unnamed protein product (macronuclear) [Paramecium tetraurelia]|uniref:Uncharacterized protein n=1 Tax=Paramecium tetraurelia TaxID=5888 RepID=A0EIT7_PARTE|nr:uncharacterized protein GSPATT00027557001 [Paramecium tetraurelia]CAK95228.1 unnamed protein product [Paramecium tetraurelia]|eukprot:XP_001462601.1 hypothetical protein (macronuclear) [Paramecium tetraurelia strain d4-2]
MYFLKIDSSNILKEAKPKYQVQLFYSLFSIQKKQMIFLTQDEMFSRRPTFQKLQYMAEAETVYFLANSLRYCKTNISCQSSNSLKKYQINRQCKLVKQNQVVVSTQSHIKKDNDIQSGKCQLKINAKISETDILY